MLSYNPSLKCNSEGFDMILRMFSIGVLFNANLITIQKFTINKGMQISNPLYFEVHGQRFKGYFSFAPSIAYSNLACSLYFYHE